MNRCKRKREKREHLSFIKSYQKSQENGTKNQVTEQTKEEEVTYKKVQLTDKIYRWLEGTVHTDTHTHICTQDIIHIKRT